MGKGSKGYRRRTRKLMRRNPRERGMAPLGNILQTYKTGSKVDIIPDPSIHKSLPHRRFCGRVGVVQGTRGRSYQVLVQEGNKEKVLFLRKEHIRPHRE